MLTFLETPNRLVVSRTGYYIYIYIFHWNAFCLFIVCICLMLHIGILGLTSMLFVLSNFNELWSHLNPSLTAFHYFLMWKINKNRVSVGPLNFLQTQSNFSKSFEVKLLQWVSFLSLWVFPMRYFLSLKSLTKNVFFSCYQLEKMLLIAWGKSLECNKHHSFNKHMLPGLQSFQLRLFSGSYPQKRCFKCDADCFLHVKKQPWAWQK